MLRRRLAMLPVPRPAAIGAPVDALIVLAVDASESIAPEDARLQREGYRAALRHEQVFAAIRAGVHGAIGLAYMHWAGADYQRLVLPWTRVADRRSGIAWGDRMEAAAAAMAGDAAAAAYPYYQATSISGGIRFAMRVLREAPWPGERLEIDISGDGPNNDGVPVEEARDAAITQGIIVNGLAIEGDPGLARELGPGATLEDYYRTAVIGGDGAFVEAVPDAASFGAAIRRKLIREIVLPLAVATSAG